MKYLISFCFLFVPYFVFGDGLACKSFETNLKTMSKLDIKAFDLPSEIFYKGAQCFKEKGEEKKANDFLSYAGMFGDEFSLLEDTRLGLLAEESSENNLAILGVLAKSKNENIAYNAKLITGFYFVTAKEITVPDYLSEKDLREYGVRLLIEASKYQHGYTALYLLSALVEIPENMERETLINSGDKKQLEYLGSIQWSCSMTLEGYRKDFPIDSSLVRDSCIKRE